MSNFIQLARIHKHLIIVCGIGGLIGAVFFLALFGWKVLEPTNVQWLLNQGDLNQHYIGWLFFRNSDWSFPLGAIHSLAFPQGISLTFTDSIPAMGIIFKIFAPILPGQFQYFGMWGIFSYILVGLFGGLIVYKLTRNTWYSIVSSLFFLASPILLNRMFQHTALASQWVILLGIFALISINAKTSIKKFLIVWSIILSLSAVIHPYFIPMNAALLLISATLSHTSVRSSLMKVIIPLFVAVILFWIIGGFMVTSVADGSLGDFPLNLNSLVNPMGWSYFLRDLPSTLGSYEGLAYLGAGVLLLVPSAVIGVFFRHKELRGYSRWQYVIAGAILFGLFLASLSPSITFNKEQLIIPLPHMIESAWSIFRATGRLFWPIYYLIILGVLYAFFLLIKTKAIRRGTLLLVCMAGLQLFDISGSLNGTMKSSTIRETSSTPTKQHDKTFVGLLKTHQHIQYIGSVDTADFLRIAPIAASLKITMSDGYFARSPHSVVQTSDEARQAILEGNPDKSTVYITTESDAIIAAKSHNLSVVNYDHVTFIN